MFSFHRLVGIIWFSVNVLPFLLSQVLSCPQEFLKKLNITLKVAVEKLTRWHPKFVLEEVPEIEPSPLPEKPGEKKITTASEALQLHRDKFDLRVSCLTTVTAILLVHLSLCR